MYDFVKGFSFFLLGATIFHSDRTYGAIMVDFNITRTPGRDFGKKEV